MYYHIDIRAEVNERSQIHGPAIFEVIAWVDDDVLYESSVLYRHRYQAEARLKELNSALFAVRCGFCGAAADYIEDIDELRGSMELDIIGWCSEDCREESLIEDAELRKAGL